MADPTISARVQAGAAWLDQHRPGWLDRIDLITLDVAVSECCVIGQLDGEYDAATFGGDARAAELGMLATGAVGWAPGTPAPAVVLAGAHAEYAALTEGWRTYVLDEGRRRAAACCPCRGPACDPGCECRSPECPRELAEVLDG